MTTDITELAQMKGQKVEGSYYLAECTDCGKMYPSNKLNGGEPLFSGDYGECHCPHCNADDAAIGDCGDTAAIAWNYQQGRIDALVEALEKAQTKAIEQGRTACELFDEVTALRQRIAELGSRTITVKQGEVLVTVAGFTGCGKSAIAGEIEIAMKAIGVPVTWANGDAEKRMTGADWLTAIEMYKPTVRIVEENIPRAAGIKLEAE